ncbi:MAG: AAA family ATPase [Firmicutes bacterium]|nr:AAA family ATPase [Bacillota bacterium]
MMKLISVEIGGFRNIENSKIILGSEMTSLVSENSYGKSNLIDAIYFATSFISVPPAVRSYMMEWRSGIPLNRKIENNDFTADFVFETEFLGESYEVNYGFSFIWIKNDGGKKIRNEWLNVRRSDNAKKYTKLISREDRPLFKASQSGRCSSVIKVADDELILNKLLNYDDLYYMPIIEELNKFNIYVERHFDASFSYEKIPLVMKNNGSSALLDMNDIPRAIHHLKENYNDRYELLIDAFMQLFPNITNIEVREIDISQSHGIKIDKDAPYTISDKVYSIYVKDKNLNQPLDFRSMSDGAKRVFLMLTAAIVANIEDMTLIAFEEPENSIHPSLLQGYLRVLTQLAGNCNIIVSSHSPYIIDYVSTENVYIGKPNSCGLADFTKIDAKKVKRMEQDALRDGVSVGSYIFELLSGGEDEFDILNTYLEK